MPAIVSLRNIVKRYTRGKQSVEVLHGLNLEIPQGEFLALMGPSGSGKTTLLNLIGGLDRPTSGEVDVAGERIDRLSGGALAKWRARHVGFVFQFYNLMPMLTAERNIELPLLLTPLLRAIQPTGVPVMLLHNYPYHREAGYLAQVFPHVYLDAGLATHNLGARAPALLAEALELAPYGKFLYSSDAFGLPELYYLGAALFRRALSAILRAGLDDDLYTERTAVRLTRMICAGNARRAYQLGERIS